MTPQDLGNPRFFAFFQLVRLLEQVTEGGQRVGGAGPAADEALRLRPEAAFGSQVASVAALDLLREDPRRYLVTVCVMGLYGVDSPLPNFYTQRVLSGDQDGAASARENNPVREFLDVFNHRLLSLLYRSWLEYRLDAQYDPKRPDSSLPDYLFALLGLEASALRQALHISHRRLLSCMGLFGQTPRSADSLARIVRRYFDAPVEVQECVGHWADIGREQQPGLGSSGATLGRELVVGTRVFIRDRVRILLGPLNFDRYIRFLPGEPGLLELRELAELFAPDGIECDVKLLILEPDTRPFSLLVDQNEQCPTRLGYTTWMRPEGSWGREREAVSVVVNPYPERAAS